MKLNKTQRRMIVFYLREHGVWAKHNDGHKVLVKKFAQLEGRKELKSTIANHAKLNNDKWVKFCNDIDASVGKLKNHLPRKSSTKFYNSKEWRQLRYQVLKEQGAKCCLCGATPKSGAIMHVDHIKPRSLRPELELDKSNLQVLCEDCNLGKSNLDDTDFR